MPTQLRRATGLLALATGLCASTAATAGQEASSAPASTDAAAKNGNVFTPDFFVRFAPQTAYDMLQQVPGFTIRAADDTRTEAALFDEIGLEVRQQSGTRDLRFGQRRRLRHADIDQMLSEPPREIVRADRLTSLSRYRPSQPFGLIERQGGRLDPFHVHHLAELPDDRTVGRDGARLVIGDGKALGERVQVRIDAGFHIFGHDRRAPCCWSEEDYAEWAWRDHAANRAFSTARGIIRVAALWVLCRYRHNGHWTGHSSRLDRDQRGGFGSADYAREELVAEMASAFACASLSIQPTVRHADYIGAWLAVLREDDKAIFRAASAAGKAADFLLRFEQTDAEAGQ